MVRRFGQVSAEGERALLGDRLTHDPQGCGEADPVRVVPGVLGGLRHQRSDRVVAAQVSPDLLEDQVGRLRTQHHPGPRWWVLSSSKAFSISQRWA